MAKLYGNRWKIVEGSHVGQGGQGEIFKVIDVRGEHTDEFALKRIRNPKRQDSISTFFRSRLEVT